MKRIGRSRGKLPSSGAPSRDQSPDRKSTHSADNQEESRSKIKFWKRKSTSEKPPPSPSPSTASVKSEKVEQEVRTKAKKCYTKCNEGEQWLVEKNP